MGLQKTTTHKFRQVVPEKVTTVFDWHRRPGAFARLTPPWQPVRIIQETTNLADGTAIIGFPAGRRWIAQHLTDEYAAERSFADVLTSRPFLVRVPWYHRHEFEADGDQTVIVDQVTTNLPRRMLEPIFAYRHRQLADDLAAHRLNANHPRPTVAITGASGLVGRSIAAFLSTGGHKVIRLVRHAPTSADEREWNPDAPNPSLFEGIDAVIHLAGHSIAGRFTAKHKNLIRSSRVEPTRLLAQVAADSGVGTFVSASAIGFYGADRGDEILAESAGPGDDFLAQVVRDWEEAAFIAGDHGMRVVTVRTGIVQSPDGGALRLQRPLFALGLGGPMASGQQWQSWIGIDDLVDIYNRALVDSSLTGPVNAVAPEPVRQRDYAATLGQVLHRPAVLPTPSFGPKLLLGTEGAQEIAFASQRVAPTRLLNLGHRFRFEALDDALAHVLGKQSINNL